MSGPSLDASVLIATYNRAALLDKTLGSLAAMRVSASRLREVRQTVLPKLPVSLWGKVLDRFLLHEELDGFGLLNAATAVTWHTPKATAAALEHNEYATERLVHYALAG